MELRARYGFVYANRFVRAGELFQANDADARLLVMCGRADDPQSEEAQPTRTVYPPAERRQRGQRGPDKKPRKRREYQRRDMKAEG